MHWVCVCVHVEGRGQLQLINQLGFLLHFMYLVVVGEEGSAQCASRGQCVGVGTLFAQLALNFLEPVPPKCWNQQACAIVPS